MSETKLVNSKTIADLFCMDMRRVQQLTKDGVISAVKRGNANRYDLRATVRQYVSHLSEKANSRRQPCCEAGADAEARKLEAEADWKRSRADMAQLQLQELEGSMHRSDDVEAVTTDLVYTIRSALLALPGRLAVDVAGAETAAEASQIIRAEVCRVLEELAGYRYDPGEYARRVREREKWRDPPDEAEDV